MQKETIQFAVEMKNGVVKRIGRSSVSKLKTNSNQKDVKWFDDSKLLK